MIIPYKPCIVADDKIFSVEKIHKKYWKEFCNVCYPLFDFENKDDGERTYEQRYETFCRCHNMATEYFMWNEKNMFLVNEQDFVRLRNAYELLIHLSSNDKAPILMLLVFLRMQQSIWNRLRSDRSMMEFIYPRECGIDYSQYEIVPSDLYPSDNRIYEDISAFEKQIINILYKEREWDEEWRYNLDVFFMHQIDYDNETKIEWDDTVGDMVGRQANLILQSYNYSLQETVSRYNNIVTKGEGDVVKAIVYRLFMSYQSSLPEIKKVFEEYPSNICFEKIQILREKLIEKFKTTKLGSHWYEFILMPDGLEKVGKYLMNHRDIISKEEEEQFFFLLDEICIFTDILKGNTKKYWLNIELVNTIENESDNELNHFAPTKNLQVLLKQDWFKDLRTKEEYDEVWTDNFVNALMSSDWKDGIARDWCAGVKRRKVKKIKGYIIGLLADAGVLKGSYDSIAKTAGIVKGSRTFSRYMGMGKKQPYAEWVQQYVSGKIE